MTIITPADRTADEAFVEHHGARLNAEAATAFALEARDVAECQANRDRDNAIEDNPTPSSRTGDWHPEGRFDLSEYAVRASWDGCPLIDSDTVRRLTPLCKNPF